MYETENQEIITIDGPNGRMSVDIQKMVENVKETAISS